MASLGSTPLVLDGEDGDDTILGSLFAEDIKGGSGNDYLAGNNGDDSLEGGTGDDNLDGGDGSDTYVFDDNAGADDLGTDTLTESATNNGHDVLDFSGFGSGTLIDLGSTAQQDVDAGGSNLDITLSDPTAFEGVVGSGQGDTIYGNDADNYLQGGGGDDYISGELGNDSLHGGAGADILLGGDGNDTLEGFTGNDTTQGGDGDDLYKFVGASLDIDDIGEDEKQGTDTLDFSGFTPGGATVDLTDASLQTVLTNHLQLNITGPVFFENLIGTDTNDNFTGNFQANLLDGRGGNDTLAGGLGNDTLIGDAGNDSLSGNKGDDVYVFEGAGDLGIDTVVEAASEGTDTLDFSGMPTGAPAGEGVTIDLTDDALQTGVHDNLQIDLNTSGNIENVVGSEFDDSIVGNSAANELYGGAGADTISGAAGEDTIDGGAGADSLSGGNDNDSISGGSENDTIAGDAGDDYLSGDADADSISGGTGNDTLFGGSGDDTLSGGNHNDVLSGGEGDDSLAGGANDDTYVFDLTGEQTLETDEINEASGQGNDTLDFSSYGDAVSVDLASGDQTVQDGLYLNFTNSPHSIEALRGSGFDDTLGGDALDNTLEGGGGDDLLDGAGGSDTYVFAQGAFGYLGSDTLTDSGSASDTDTLDFSQMAAAVDVLMSQASGVINDDLDLTFTDVTDFENLIGSDYDDTLGGNANDNVLTGGSGNDLYQFSGSSDLGSDTIVEASDSLSGSDTLDFDGFTAGGVNVNLADSDGQTVYTAKLHLTFEDTTGANASNIENVVGSDSNDTLAGTTGDNILEGGQGDDSLSGGDGNDTYVFAQDATEDLGSDTLVEGTGAGSGSDTLDFSGMAVSAGGNDGVNINLASTANQLVHDDDLDIDLSSGSAFENVVGSAFDDSITGNTQDNILEGGAGNDTLVGDTGNDTYVFSGTADLGSDTIVEASGEGTDALDFSGLGDDTVAGNNAGVSIDLSDNTPQTSVHDLIDLELDDGDYIENVIGSDYDDTIVTNARDNLLTGGLGSDRYVFAPGTSDLGDDTIVESGDAGGGIDTLDFSGMAEGAPAGEGVIIDLSNTGLQTVHDYLQLDLEGNDTVVHVENVIGSDYNDTITGNDAANVLEGGKGNDTLSGGDGDDRYVFDDSGGVDDLGTDSLTENTDKGTDTLDFSSFSTKVDIDLGDATPQDVDIPGSDLDLVLSSATAFENVIGTAGDDTITGNTADNYLQGGAGNDTLIGDSGNDTLEGEAGDDSLSGGTGNDTYAFSGGSALGNDTIVEGASGDTDVLNFLGMDDGTPDGAGIKINLGVDTLQAVHDNLGLTLSTSANIEDVVGTLYDDTIEGNASNNLLDGSAGDDTYVFSGGSDLGNDTLVESANVDADTLDFGGFSAAITVDLSDGDGQDVHGNVNLTFNLPVDDDAVTAFSLDDTDGFFQHGDGYMAPSGVSGETDEKFFRGKESEVAGETADADGYYWYFLESDGELRQLKYYFYDVAFNALVATFSTDYYDDPSLLHEAVTSFAVTGLENVIGTNYADLITGNDRDNRLAGGQANDTLIGGTGDDTYAFSGSSDLGSDTIVEGNDSDSGSDTLDFDGFTAGGVNVNLADSDGQTVYTAKIHLTFEDTTGANASNIENVKGSDYGDTLAGTSGDNILEGGQGDDSLSGGDGDDTYVFTQYDTTPEDLGTDTLTEDLTEGTDMLDFSGYAAGVTVDLADLSPQTVQTSKLALDLNSNDTDGGVENVIGSAFDDQIHGNTADNMLLGGDGDDTLWGHDGEDYLDGQDGDDSLRGGNHNDTILGGEGDDTVSADWDVAGSDLIYGGAGNDRLLGEGENDTIYGEAGNDILRGGLENDYLDGGDGNDTLIGGDGNDTLIGGEGNDKLQGQDGDDWLDGGAGNDRLYGDAPDSGDDTLIGGTGDDSLFGGAGDDTYVFSRIGTEDLGTDTITEAANVDTDTLDFSDFGAGVSVDLSSTSGQSVHAKLNLTLTDATGLENVIGSAFADYIMGNSRANSMLGNAGDDTISGAGGDDTIVGGAGDDSLMGDADNDLIYGGAGDDLLYGGGGTDTGYGGDDTDSDPDSDIETWNTDGPNEP